MVPDCSLLAKSLAACCARIASFPVLQDDAAPPSPIDEPPIQQSLYLSKISLSNHVAIYIDHLQADEVVYFDECRVERNTLRIDPAD
jgi:hypothetical protein